MPPHAVRCLFVDDDPAIRMLLTVQAEFLGADVTEAQDVEEALGLLADGPCPFDVVVTDHRLPGDRRGAEVLQAAVQRCPDSARFLLTAHISGTSTSEAQQHDARMVDKIDLSPILDRIRELAGQAPAGSDDA